MRGNARKRKYIGHPSELFAGVSPQLPSNHATLTPTNEHDPIRCILVDGVFVVPNHDDMKRLSQHGQFGRLSLMKYGEALQHSGTQPPTLDIPNGSLYILAHDEALFLHDELHAISVYTSVAEIARLGLSINLTHASTPDVEPSQLDLVPKSSFREVCLALSPSLSQTYPIYVSLRGRGFVPKSSLRYGSTWAVYDTAPSHAHAKYTLSHLNPETVCADESAWRWRQRKSLMRDRVALGANKIAAQAYTAIDASLSVSPSEHKDESVSIDETDHTGTHVTSHVNDSHSTYNNVQWAVTVASDSDSDADDPTSTEPCSGPRDTAPASIPHPAAAAVRVSLINAWRPGGPPGGVKKNK
jgi:hypothetical protein